MPGAGMSQPGAAAQPRPPTGPGAAFVVPANTFPNPIDAMRAPPVPTHVGVTRETPGAASPGKGGRIAIVALLAGMVLLGGTAAIVVMRHPATGAGVRATQDSATTATTAPPIPSDTAAGTPSLQLAPLPSVTTFCLGSYVRVDRGADRDGRSLEQAPSAARWKSRRCTTALLTLDPCQRIATAS